jgi:hypothetical protein
LSGKKAVVLRGDECGDHLGLTLLKVLGPRSSTSARARIGRAVSGRNAKALVVPGNPSGSRICGIGAVPHPNIGLLSVTVNATRTQYFKSITEVASGARNTVSLSRRINATRLTPYGTAD